MAIDLSKYLAKKAASGQISPDEYMQTQIEKDPINVTPEVSQLESGLRGGIQGATLGFGDEAAGGIGSLAALPDTVSLGEEGLNVDFNPILEKYREVRDDVRSKNKLAEEANPKTYLGGNLAGGLATTVLTGGLGTSVKGAALLGGAAGLGSSDAELTKPDAQQLTTAATDTTLGAGLGVALAGIPKGLGYLKNAALDTTAGKAFQRGLQGEVIDGSFTNKVGKAAVDFSKKYSGKMQGLEQGLAKEKSQLIKGNQTPIDLNDVRSNLESKLMSISPEGQNVAGLGDIKQSVLQDVGDAFGDKTVKELQQVSKMGSVSKKYPKTESARELLEQEIAKEKITAEALGQNIRHEIKESVGADGKKYLTKITTSDEPIGAAEKLIPVKDDSGNIIDQILQKADDNYKTTAKAKTVEDIPGMPKRTVFTPKQETEIVEIINKVKNNEPITAEQASILKDTLENMKGVKGYKDISTIDRALSEAQSGITSKLNELPGVKPVNEKLINVNAAREAGGIGSDFGKKPLDFNMEDPRQYNLNDLLHKAAGETSRAGVPSDKMSSMLSRLKKVDPNLVQEMESQIPKMLEDIQISQGLDPSFYFSKSGAAKQIVTKAANPLGRGIKATGDLANKLTLGAAKPAYEAAKIFSKEALPRFSSGVQTGIGKDTSAADSSKLRTKFTDLDNDQLVEMAQRLRKSPGLEGVASKIEKASESGDPREKIQAEFLIQQNPNARKLIENPNEEE